MGDSPRQRFIDSLNGRGQGLPVALWEPAMGLDRLFEEVGRDRVTVLRSVSLTRTEHPHCAFYRTAITSGERTGTGTVLHTPEGKLTQEAYPDPETGDMVIEKHFVGKPKQYSVLLAYLRDACVKPDYREYVKAVDELGDQGLPMVAVMRTPMVQMLARWRDREDFSADLQSHEEAIGHCIYQMKRLFHEQTAVLTAMEDGKIDALWVPDALDCQVISPDDFHHYCLPRYRELHTALPGTVVAVQAGSRLKQYWDDPRELPAHGCLAFSMDGDLPVAEALTAWTRRSLMVELSPSLCQCPSGDIAAAVQKLAALPGSRERMALIMPRGLPGDVLLKSLRAALDAAGW